MDDDRSAGRDGRRISGRGWRRVDDRRQPRSTRLVRIGARRVGAITVFVTGEMYAGSPFSTRTTIVDMATGEALGDLEQFSTWRNGVRFKAADFNFWGVTFARDSNVFYATLRTAANAVGG